MKILAPEYYDKFRCIGALCTDSCCTGWDVVIDKITHDKYRQLPPGPLQDTLMQRIKVDSASTSEQLYATVELDGEVCPFFEGLCRIQTTLGENYLSHTCATYPRAQNKVDGSLEYSLYLSCPEAARLALSSPDKMAYQATDGKTPRGNILSLLSTRDNSKSYRHFQLIRNFVIDLLQNRDLPLWQRLIILGFTMKKLDELARGEYPLIPKILEGFEGSIKEGAYTELLTNFAPDLELQLQVTTILLNHRLQETRCPERFAEYYNKVLSDIGYETEPFSVSVKHYSKSYQDYYLPFEAKYGYILENYLVNYVFKSLFPLGPTTSLYKNERSLYAEYILLVCNFALVKTLLVGMAGYYEGNIGPDEAISIIQNYSKAVEHNLGYQQKLVQFIEASNMASNAALAILIKN